MVKCPVLVIAYNRPYETRVLLDALERLHVTNVWIFVDGPKDKLDEQKVKKVRDLAVSYVVDSDKRKFSKRNQGCRKGVTSAIDWFFDNVPEGFILEDDCIPSSDFFQLGTFVLKSYRNDSRVMQFSGRMPIAKEFLPRGVKRAGFGFDRVGSTWGWATWASAWQRFDRNLNLLQSEDPLQALPASAQKSHRVRAALEGYRAVKAGLVDTWDYQWLITKVFYDGLTVVPAVNLVQNIGFTESATHTKKQPSFLRNDIEPLGQIRFNRVPAKASKGLSAILEKRHQFVSASNHARKMFHRFRKDLARIARVCCQRR